MTANRVSRYVNPATWWRRVRRRLGRLFGGGDVAVAMETIQCGNRYCWLPATKQMRWPGPHGWIWEYVCDDHEDDLRADMARIMPGSEMIVVVLPLPGPPVHYHCRGVFVDPPSGWLTLGGWPIPRTRGL